MLARFLDWRLRKVRRYSDLPDLPEVRKLIRISYINGFTGGRYHAEERLAQAEALAAVNRWDKFHQRDLRGS